MAKPKAYTWLNPDLKKAMKFKAFEEGKQLLDLMPEDFMLKKKDKFRFKI